MSVLPENFHHKKRIGISRKRLPREEESKKEMQIMRENFFVKRWLILSLEFGAPQGSGKNEEKVLRKPADDQRRGL